MALDGNPEIVLHIGQTPTSDVLLPLPMWLAGSSLTNSRWISVGCHCKTVD